jgi:ABC-type transporter Mla subunit MlaD
VLGGAAAAADAVETAINLVPRAAAAITRVESLLDRLEAVADRADLLVERTDKVVDTAELATVRAQKTLDAADVVTREAGRRTDAAAGVLDRLDSALVQWEPTLRRLAPQAKRFAEQLAEHEVDAAISLVDRMPVLLEHVETDVLPMLSKLDRVGPDLHELLEVVEDLRRVVTGLPGIGLLRKRGDDEPPKSSS